MHTHTYIYPESATQLLTVSAVRLGTQSRQKWCLAQTAFVKELIYQDEAHLKKHGATFGWRDQPTQHSTFTVPVPARQCFKTYTFFPVSVKRRRVLDSKLATCGC